MSGRGLACGFGWCLLVVGCGGGEGSDVPAPAGARTSSLMPGVIARVGSLPITSDVVAAVASSQRVSPRTALELEIADALLANAARDRGDADAWGARAAVRGVLARARLEILRAQSAKEEIRASEVADATARHFVELDRPETFRVTHAVVRVPEHADDAARKRARAVAEALALHVAGAADETEFRARAESLPDRGGFELVIESLSPVAADGRVINLDPPSPGGSYEEPFARAASRLTRAAEQSPVVTTSFGFHVLMLVERLPAHVVPFAERLGLLHDEILTGRAREARHQLVEELRAPSPPVVERNAEAFMSSVAVTRHESL